MQDCLEVLEDCNGVDGSSPDVVSISSKGKIGISKRSKRTEKLDSKVFEDVWQLWK